MHLAFISDAQGWIFVLKIRLFSEASVLLLGSQIGKEREIHNFIPNPKRCSIAILVKIGHAISKMFNSNDAQW